jgi:type II secretory pathway component PulL
MKIELSSEELAEDLQKHLEGKRFTGGSYDKARKTIEFSDDLRPAQWASLRGTVENWARTRNLEIEESLKIQAPVPEDPQAKEVAKEQQAEVKKRLAGLTLEEAEARFNFLQSKPFSELTDSEYEERLALAETLSQKSKGSKR